MNRLNCPSIRLLILIMVLGAVGFARQSKASPFHSALSVSDVSMGSYVVVAFEVFGTQYYHFRDFDTANLYSPESQAYLKTVIRYDRRALRDRNVSNDDIRVLQSWGFASSAEAANFACNLERQGLQVWSTSACYVAPAQPTTPTVPAQPTPSSPAPPSEPYRSPETPGYPAQPATLAGRIIKSSQSPAVNESVRYEVEASDSSDPYAPLSYNWFVDGQPVVQSDGYSLYDSPTLHWAFNAKGSHTLAVTVTNRYTGLSAQIKDSVRVIDSAGPITGERDTTTGVIDNEPDFTPVIVTVIGIVVGLLAVSIILALLKTLFFRVAK